MCSGCAHHDQKIECCGVLAVIVQVHVRMHAYIYALSDCCVLEAWDGRAGHFLTVCALI